MNSSSQHVENKLILALGAWGLITMLTACAVFTGEADKSEIHFIRHAEFDKSTPDKPLNEKGKRRAQALISHFQGQNISQIYATHTDRTFDTVAPLAKARGIAIQQVPGQGQTIGGKAVTNLSSGKIAIKPMIHSLKQVQQGSSTVVSANSGNIFAIMAGVGVPVKGEAACTDSVECLPCKTKKCFPGKEFNNIWTVTISSEGKLSLQNSKYEI
jgi:hypothetical protein